MVLGGSVSFPIPFFDDTQILPNFLEKAYIGPYLKGVVSSYSELPFAGQDVFYLMVSVTQYVTSETWPGMMCNLNILPVV